VFRRIDAHDGESLTAHFGNARPDNPVGLLERLPTAQPRLTMRTMGRSRSVRHLDSPHLGKVEGFDLTFSPKAIQAPLLRDFLVSKASYLADPAVLGTMQLPA
jgi:hypothetical protein